LQTLMEMIHGQKFPVISLFAIVFGILITNLISEDAAIVFAGWGYVVTAGSVVVLILIIINKTRGIGSHGKAWILFAVMAISWFVAEQLRNVNELAKFVPARIIKPVRTINVRI